jgi:16S rRNA (uracil1498-N3)-methyltransferase
MPQPLDPRALYRMTRRYFVPDLPLRGGVVPLPESEAQHAARVMRVQPGERITLFDGKGHESQAVVRAVRKRECECDAEAAVAVDREPSRSLHLGVALPKSDRARQLIERLTELGVRTVTPLVAERSQRPPSVSLLEKLSRAVVEASKQCGRNRLLEIGDAQDAKSFFDDHPPAGGSRWIAHPDGQPIGPLAAEPHATVVAAVGPEGGWTDAELQVASQCGFVTVGLGKRIYRIETAASIIGAVLSD